MAKKAKVWDGSAWQDLVNATQDLTPYSTTAQMNTAIAASAGLTLINSTTFTTSAGVAIDNVFSSTYDNYRVNFELTAASSTDVEIYWYGRSGSPAVDTTTNYNTQGLRQNGTTVAGSNLTNSRFATSTSAYATYTKARLDLFSPNLALRTIGMSDTYWVDSAGTITTNRFMNLQDTTTQFTGIKFSPGGGTISGTVRIYGYKNS
jgi:hypothetical protein